MVATARRRARWPGPWGEYTEFEGTEEEAEELVISLNAQRRDLKPGQKAIVAARFWRANGDGKPGRKSSESPTIGVKTISKRFKTTDKSVLQARDLLAEASDLADRVAAGLCSSLTRKTN
jgi:hypothetical protein